MTKRRRFTEMEVIETLKRQGVEVFCHRCHVPFDLADIEQDQIEREHLFEIALGGPDMPQNCAYSHVDCHAIVTNGTKATTAGSSKHRIGKVKRIQGGKMAIKKGAKKKRSAWPKRKMQSKGFVKI